MIFTNTGFALRGNDMRLLRDYRELVGKTITAIHDSCELYILCDSGDLCILNYGDESRFRNEYLNHRTIYTVEYFSKKHGLELDEELLAQINEIKARDKYFEIRDYIIAKIKFERNTDKFNYWKVQDVMDTYTVPIQHVEEIINKVLENYEEPETDEELK